MVQTVHCDEPEKNHWLKTDDVNLKSKIRLPTTTYRLYFFMKEKNLVVQGIT